MSQTLSTGHTGDGQPSPVSKSKRWIRFLLVVLVLAALIYLAPLVERLPVLGEKITVLRESGINVGAWYYDDVEQYFEAEDYIRERKELTRHGKDRDD